MSTFFAYLLPGIFTGAAYAIAASGLVLTYTTTRVFNIAHGAFGMLFAFVFYDFVVVQGLPSWLALILVLGVVAPALGVLIQRFVARGLGDAPVSVSLVVTVAMFVFLLGFAQRFFPPEARNPVVFFPEKSWAIGETIITAQQAITVLASILVAAGLYLLLNKTRIGTAMRASVDNPELLKLFGGKPDTAAAISWAIGISLAALAGILLAPSIGLDYVFLTLLVFNTYGAAVFGRLKSLPLTFAGAMALGILDSFWLGYIKPDEGFLSFLYDYRPALPAAFLLVSLIFLPQAQLRIGQVKGIVAAPVPSFNRSVVAGVGLIVFALLLVTGFSEANLLSMGTAVVFAMIMLSLTLLTGYGGLVSLAQLSFAGVGALVYAKGGISINLFLFRLDVSAPSNLAGLLVAALVAGVAGALVALPVLRLTGLYLALATIGFAILMEKQIFQDESAGFGFGGALEANRFSIFGRQFTSTSSYVLVMVVIFVIVAVGILMMRRGVLGRMLIATRDSPAACGTLGLDLRWFRVGLFGASAAIAGLAGALYAGLRGTIGASDFQVFASLPLLLMVVVFGVTSVTGAVLGGAGLMLLNNADDEKRALLSIVIAIGAILIGRDPNGLANYAFIGGRYLQSLVITKLMDSLPDLPAMPGRPGRPGRFGRSSGTEVDGPTGEPFDPDHPPDLAADPGPDREEVPAHAAP